RGSLHAVHRQFYRERRSTAGSRPDTDAPAMFLDDRVGNGQAESGAFAHLFRGEKRIEDPGLDVAGHARAIVGYLEDGDVAIDVVTRADRQDAPTVRAEHRLFGVDQQ